MDGLGRRTDITDLIDQDPDETPTRVSGEIQGSRSAFGITRRLPFLTAANNNEENREAD
jgi:hypothetical protein